MSNQYDCNYYYTGGFNYGAPPVSSYPSEGFAYQNSSSYSSQPYYGQSQPQSHNTAAQYYNSSAPQNGSQYSDDRGLLGAMAGGATGAYGGHKVGHGVLGAIGGAILGSLTEDYAKGKNKKHKKTSSSHHHHQHQHHYQQKQQYQHSKHGSTSSNSSQGSAFGGLSNAVNGLGPVASQFFGSHGSKR